MRKLLLGDCLDLMKSIPSGSVDLIVTDPPYEIEDMGPFFTEMLRSLSKDGSIYVFGNKNMIAEHWFSQLKIQNKDLLVWHYKNSPKPKGRWRMSMQPIIYGYRGNSIFNEDSVRVEYKESTKKLNGRIRPALLGHLSKERTGHRDQKPISIITDLVLASSNEGQLVLDPFGGSGTTAEVCLRTNRKFITMELDSGNFEKIKIRLKNLSDDTPFETEW